MDGSEDRELAGLMRAAIAGDENAYADFLRRAASLIRAFARKNIRRGGIDPEDIVQETLLAIHIKRHTWRDEGSVLPWIYAIARYKLIDAFRRRGRLAEIHIDEVADSLVAAVETETVSQREIERAFASLAPGQRSVVAAMTVDGYSIGETARSLGLSETAVRVALHRGLKAIAKRFGRQ